jgi:hypothetical protein
MRPLADCKALGPGKGELPLLEDVTKQRVVDRD